MTVYDYTTALDRAALRVPSAAARLPGDRRAAYPILLLAAEWLQRGQLSPLILQACEAEGTNAADAITLAQTLATIAMRGAAMGRGA